MFEVEASMGTYYQGYEAAYTELYAAIDSDDHPRNCGVCRACGVIRTVIEDTFLKLGGLLTPEEFDTLAAMLARLNRD